MYLFAHLFAGILLGLGAFHITRDRRAFPVCIAGALLPDLLDKPLMLLVPGVFGSTRTIGHSLLFVTVLLLAGILLWYRGRTPLGIVFAAAVLLHQVPDLMWTDPVTWFFPLHGMFLAVPDPGGFFPFLWTELTNPSEWVFVVASCIVLIGYAGVPGSRLPFLSCRSISLMQYGTAILLWITGAGLIVAGSDLIFGTIPALHAGPDKTLMAGLVALSGATVLILVERAGCRWRGSK